jgi:hypothetical protein
MVKYITMAVILTCIVILGTTLFIRGSLISLEGGGGCKIVDVKVIEKLN